MTIKVCNKVLALALLCAGVTNVEASRELVTFSATNVAHEGPVAIFKECYEGEKAIPVERFSASIEIKIGILGKKDVVGNKLQDISKFAEKRFLHLNGFRDAGREEVRTGHGKSTSWRFSQIGTLSPWSAAEIAAKHADDAAQTAKNERAKTAEAQRIKNEQRRKDAEKEEAKKAKQRKQELEARLAREALEREEERELEKSNKAAYVRWEERDRKAREAKETNAEHGRTTFLSALECFGRGDCVKALALLREAAEVDGEPCALHHLGMMYYGDPCLYGHQHFERDLDKASDLLTEAARQHHVLSIANVGHILLERGKYDKAIVWFLRHPETDTNFILQFHLGRAYLMKGDTESARYWLTKAKQLLPNKLEVLLFYRRNDIVPFTVKIITAYINCIEFVIRDLSSWFINRPVAKASWSH